MDFFEALKEKARINTGKILGLSCYEEEDIIDATIAALKEMMVGRGTLYYRVSEHWVFWDSIEDDAWEEGGVELDIIALRKEDDKEKD